MHADTPDPTELRDQAVMERLHRGDRAALAELFHSYYDPLARFALQLTGDRAAAEDVVQDLFVRLWEGRSRIGFKVSVRRYLYKSVRNAVADKARSERVRARVVEQSMEYGVTDPEHTNTDPLDITVAVGRAIADLPEQSRLVFVLHTEHAMTHAEIGVVLGISPRTSEALMSRALQRIRENIQTQRG